MTGISSLLATYVITVILIIDHAEQYPENLTPSECSRLLLAHFCGRINCEALK